MKRILILITKAEKKIIAEKIPHAPIKKTVNHYYCEESPAVLRILKQLRGEVRK